MKALMHAIASACAVFWIDGTSAECQALRPATDGRASTNLTLTFLGTAGWQIFDGTTVILIDPFLSLDSIQAHGRARGRRMDPLPDPDEIVPLDTSKIQKYVTRANYVLVTHGHADHALEAGYIAKRLGAVVIAHQSAANLARAYGVGDSSIITVRGGEDYEFGAFSLRVIPSIHSALNNKRYFNRPIAGNTPAGVKAPLTVRNFQEGGSLAFLLRIAGHQILIMGSMNYIEREMEGLRPDVALVGANRNRREIYRYTARLLRALGYPNTVVATHCCSGPVDDEARVFAAEVVSAAPGTQVIIPERFKLVVLAARK